MAPDRHDGLIVAAVRPSGLTRSFGLIRPKPGYSPVRRAANLIAALTSERRYGQMRPGSYR